MVMLPLVLKQLQRWDERRTGVPGEHWVAFGTGIAFLQMAGRGRAPWLRAAAGIAGVAMIWRAASGRDGFLRQLREASPAARRELRSKGGESARAGPLRLPEGVQASPARGDVD